MMHTLALLVAGTTCFFALWLMGCALSGGAMRMWFALSPVSSAARQARALWTAIILPLLLAGLLSAHATWTAATCSLVEQERSLVGPCVHATRHLCAHVSEAMTRLTQGVAWGGMALAALLVGVVTLIIICSIVQSRRPRACWTERPPSRKLRKAIVQTAEQHGVRSLQIFETPDDVPGAAIVGWFKPRCLVAQSFVRAANVPELRVVLRHELAHVARRDNLARLVVNACRKLLFFFPPARWLCREWDKCVEFACDDAAVQTPQDALHLASALVKACRSSAHAMGRTAALMGEWSSVEQRVRRLLVGNLQSSMNGDFRQVPAPRRAPRVGTATRHPQSELSLRLIAATSFFVLAWTVAISFDLSLHCAIETLARLTIW